MSYWPINAGHLAIQLSLYQTLAPLTVTILAPEAGEIVTVDDPVIEWALASGTQVRRRVRIFDPDGVTTVYDSTTDTTATLQEQVTAGLLETGVEGYILRVEVENDEGLIGVALQVFSTVFQPSVAIEGVRLTELGDKCNVGSVVELPGVEVRWTQVVPAVGEQFQSYRVLRRASGETAWTTIATITDITQTRHTDYNFRARETNEYTVIWTVLDGTEVLVSLPVDTPRATVDFDWTFLHDWADPENWVCFFSFEQSQGVEADRQFDRLWGRQAPTAFIGPAEYETIGIDGLPDVYRGGVWDDTRSLFARQRTDGATIVFRNGIAGTRFFCSFAELDRSLGQRQYEPRTELIETNFDESAQSAQ